MIEIIDNIGVTQKYLVDYAPKAGDVFHLPVMRLLLVVCQHGAGVVFSMPGAKLCYDPPLTIKMADWTQVVAVQVKEVGITIR